MKIKRTFIPVLLFLLLVACGADTPLTDLQQRLADTPEYTVILEDMKEEGNFFKDYYHKYKYVYAEPASGETGKNFVQNVTEWQKVPKSEFQNYADNLGMVVASRTADGEESEQPYPPGYQYVGNSDYGQWRTNSNGNSFWEFYGKYAMLQTVFGMFGNPVSRGDWDDYRSYRGRGVPYYGRDNQYGTRGTYTQKTHKSFFERRQAREQLRKQSFQEKVKQRARRSNMSSTRRRSGGFGK